MRSISAAVVAVAARALLYYRYSGEATIENSVKGRVGERDRERVCCVVRNSSLTSSLQILLGGDAFV